LKDRIGVGVIGMGFMGAQHAKVISELPEARLSAAQDADEERAKAVANMYKTGKPVNI
jgi:UDP-N-acetylglucosamine 3-dehydrogenase